MPHGPSPRLTPGKLLRHLTLSAGHSPLLSTSATKPTQASHSTAHPQLPQYHARQQTPEEHLLAIVVPKPHRVRSFNLFTVSKHHLSAVS